VYTVELYARVRRAVIVDQMSEREAARHFGLLSSLQDKQWVVYFKPPFGGPQQVLQYLARYTHRVAISNGRLLSLANGRVRFRWRDSQDNNQLKETSLDAVEFIRRFLLHVLPSGFVKIRHFGFLSNSNRKTMIPRCRELLPPSALEAFIVEPHQPLCPVCKVGHLHVIDWGHIPTVAAALYRQVPTVDSSWPMISVRYIADQHRLPVCGHIRGVPSHLILIGENRTAQHCCGSPPQQCIDFAADHDQTKPAVLPRPRSKLETNPHKDPLAA
jgi:hypothetical protein